MNRHLLVIVTMALLLASRCTLIAQPYATIDLDKDKPKKYETRELRSEKTGDKKLTANRRLFQNAFTHYNYYFNANNKLNDIITRSKLAFKDDYTKLLPFYNYSLDATVNENTELDSVIYKCTAGILLHDLRNDWIDNLYLMLGKAYLLSKKYDSAGYVFQYINYAWAPKDDGYDIILGSNASNTNGVFTVSTNEKASILKKAFSTAPSRNESLLWEARNYLEQDKIGDATGLLSILSSDPVFPKRLKTDLHELIAYNYYKQASYDSAASHLKLALNNADGRLETARWEFLCGQMYALAGKNDDAIGMFTNSIAHTTDPVMEVYTRLNIVDLASSKRNNGMQSNLLEMYRLAKREKYINYRDIIYQVIATIEQRFNNIPNTILALTEGIKNANPDNAALKQKSLLMLADIYYNEKKYPTAHNYYDSIETALLPPLDKERVESLRPVLKTVIANINTIQTQDSLQYLANLPEAERNKVVKKLVRKLRKEQGLKDDASFEALDNTAFGVPTAPVNMFDNNAASEFYFSNTSFKQKGFAEFKSRWGVRQNVDNWQRQAVPQSAAPSLTVDVDDVSGTLNKGEAANDKPKDLSFEGLMGDIPLTEDQLFASNDSVAKAYFNNGITFQNALQDYPSAIACFDSLLRRFPNDDKRPQAILNLAFCYKQISQVVKADSLNKLLKTNYPKQKFTNIFANELTSKDSANATYQNVYNLFVEGKFEQAKEAKKQADSQLGKSYWTPQLLYIESIYYVKQKDDSTAINRLQSLVSNFPKSPLADKANTMIDVLKSRTEIEAHLTNYNEENKEEETAKRIDLSEPTGTRLNPEKLDKLVNVIKSPTLKPEPVDIKITNAQKSKMESETRLPTVNKEKEAIRGEDLSETNRINLIPATLAKINNVTKSPKLESKLVDIKLINALKKRTEIETLLTNLDKEKEEKDAIKRDSVFDASRIKLSSVTLAKINNITKSPKLESKLVDNKMVNALKKRTETETLLTALNKEIAEKEAVKREDLLDATRIKLIPATLAKLNHAIKSPSLQSKTVDIKIKDKLNLTNLIEPNNNTFQFKPTQEHFVVLILDKVDETLAGEVKNAFNIFNKERFSDAKILITNAYISSQFSFVLFGPFTNASDAIEYVDKTKPSAVGRIIPWLEPSKYSFSIISNKNLDILKTGKEVAVYTQFLKGIFPDKF